MAQAHHHTSLIKTLRFIQPSSAHFQASATMRLGWSLPQLKAALSLRRQPASTATLFIRRASSETKTPTENQDKVSADPDYVSINEMKGLIERYDKGDMDAIPSIFEAILKRKLVNKKNNIQSDPEFEQLVEGRRLGVDSITDSDDDEDLLDVDTEQDGTELDSDWDSDDEKRNK